MIPGSKLNCAAPSPNGEEIARAISTLHPDGGIIELRAIYKGGRKRIDAGCFDADHREIAVNEAVRLNRAGAAVYFNLNQLDTQLQARYSNRIEEYASSTATDNNVTRRRWLLLDLDAQRPKDTSSTPEQLAHATERGRVVVEHLTAQGWPKPIAAESGNGVHLLYAIDLPNDDASRTLISGCLKALAGRFDDAVVKVDQSVFNAARIVKLHGTIANKGDNIPAAPWRLSKLTEVPGDIKLVATQQLEVLAGIGGPASDRAKRDTRPDINSGTSWTEGDLQTFLAKGGIDAIGPESHESGQRWKLTRCPFNPDHGYGEAAVFLQPNGRLGFKCQHNGCKDKHWSDLRVLVDGPREQRHNATQPRNEASRSIEVQSAAELDPLDIPPASSWAERDPPPDRDWICEGLGLPAARVISMIGNGGFGKTTIAAQIMVAVATSQPLWGNPVAGGCVVGFFCEDEQPEIERKIRTICDVESIPLDSLENLHALSRDGDDNVLASFDHDRIILSEFYHRLDSTLARYRPRLTIIDTAADVFAGDFMSTPHVRQFIKTALGGLCKRHETAVLLLAHPSASAMATGDGGGFSTAWNNSVRSRLYLRRPKSDDADEVADRRVIEIKKSNYGPSGGVVPLIYHRGRFVLDSDPIDEGRTGGRKAAKADTRLSMAVMTYFENTAASGQVVAFGSIFKALQTAGDLDLAVDPKGIEKVRKQLQRTLKVLLSEGLIRSCDVPRGYRIAAEAPV